MQCVVSEFMLKISILCLHKRNRKRFENNTVALTRALETIHYRNYIISHIKTIV